MTLTRTVWFISHPKVIVEPAIPVPRWGLSELGRSRARALCGAPFLRGASSVWSSREAKARETARVITPPGVPLFEREDLGENDRSSTGFVVLERFEELVDAFFARPRESVEGWATAGDEQRRIVSAVAAVLADERSGEGDVVIVAHGGVGALLLADLLRLPITRDLDQPGQATRSLSTVTNAAWSTLGYLSRTSSSATPDHLRGHAPRDDRPTTRGRAHHSKQ